MALSIEEARIHADKELAIRAELAELQAMLENKDYRTKVEKAAIGAAIQDKRNELTAHIATANA